MFGKWHAWHSDRKECSSLRSYMYSVYAISFDWFTAMLKCLAVVLQLSIHCTDILKQKHVYSNRNSELALFTGTGTTVNHTCRRSWECRGEKKIKMDREQIIRMLSNRGVGRCTCVLHAPHKVCELICMWDRHNVNISTLLHRQAGKKKHKLPVYRELMNVSRVLWCKWRYRKICFSLITSFLIEFQHLCSRVRTHPALATSPTPLPPLSVFLARGFFWTANSVIRQLWHDWNWINGGERMREATKKLYF